MPQRPKQQDRSGLAARRAAFQILEAVLIDARPLDDALDPVLDKAGLDRRDRNLARQLAMTALRHYGEAKRLGRLCLDRPLPKNAGAVEILFALGVAQLFYLDVPDHAAIATTVELAARDKRPRLRGFKNLINAVLRRLSRESEALRAKIDPARANLPKWLWESWTEAYGEATVRAIAAVHAQTPPLDLTARSAEDRAWMIAAMPDAEALPDGGLRLKEAGQVEKLPGYDDGRWWVQDAAAALPARLLQTGKGERALDLCAAPGGKTLQLASMGAEVTALDQSAKRLGRLRDNLARTGLKAQIVTADAASWTTDRPFDAVLLDAPCSATGTVRRHPDLPHLKRRQDVQALAALQTAMIDNALNALKPGGRLVYCVCSLEPQEGEAQIDAALGRHPGLRLAPLQAAEVPGLEAALNGKGCLRILPSHWAERGGLDGFFIARLIKP